MKIKEKINFTKLTRSGISLMLLVVTIVVIIVLCTSVVVTVVETSPIFDANRARYETDVENLQVTFTNMILTIMLETRGSVEIVPGRINLSEVSGDFATGEASFQVTNSKINDNIYGKIVFDKGVNDESRYFIGTKLPVYVHGDTTWYVDENFKISVVVSGKKFGNGKLPE